MTCHTQDHDKATLRHIILYPSHPSHASKQRRINRPARLRIQPPVQLFEQLHRVPTKVLLRLLTGPHRLLMDADEVDLELAARLRGVWRELDDEVDGPGVVAIEGGLFDVMPGVFGGRVVVESPLEDVRVERDGWKMG